MKKLFSWDFFIGLSAGILIGMLLLLFILFKGVDEQIEDNERLRKKEVIIDKVHDYLNEIDMIKEWNEKAVIVEPEGK